MLALNEVGGMVQKAARGACIPLGQAEDLGRVAVYLAATGSGVTAITNALQERYAPLALDWDTVTVLSGQAALVAPAIRDAFMMGYDSAELADITHAPLVGAFLGQSGIALRWEGLRLTRSDTTVLSAACKPVTIPPEDWAIWSNLAANTYVPETDASRLAGAGAGLNDND
jgi:hypothetical protein